MHTENDTGSEVEAQSLPADAAPVTKAEVEAGATPGADLLVRLISEIEGLHRAIQHGFGTTAFMNGVVERLVNSEALAPLIDRLIVERISLMQQAARPADADVPKIIGLRAVLFLTVDDEANRDLKVARLAANHPTNPSGIEAYLRDGDHWHAAPLGDLAAEAIDTAMKEIQAAPGDFYWVDFFQITNLPIPGIPNQRLNAAGEVVVEEAAESEASTESAPESAMQSPDSPTA